MGGAQAAKVMTIVAEDRARGQGSELTAEQREALETQSARIIEDMEIDEDGDRELGRLAHYVRDRRIPLELCPTSNVHTGAVADVADHPIGLLRSLGFRITVNTDNRLMSGVSMTSEMAALNDAFGWGLEDFRWLTINAMKSAFLPFDERLELINGTVKPGYAALAG